MMWWRNPNDPRPRDLGVPRYVQEEADVNQVKAQTSFPARCGNDACDRHIYLVSPFAFYLIDAPLVFCSADCLCVWEKSVEAYLERR